MMNKIFGKLTNILVMLLVIAGCSKSEKNKVTVSETSSSEKAEPKNIEKTKPKLEKLVFAFQKQKDPAKVKESADKVSKVLSEALGLPVDVMIPASYGASVQAMVSNKAQIAYLSSIPFLLAKSEAPVKPLLVELRKDQTFYDSVFVVKADSEFKNLSDLKGKRMMFTSPTSTSGYVMAYSRLVNDKLLKPAEDPASFFSSVNFAGGYDRALLAVANGQADVCAVSDYTMSGPKADLYLPAEKRKNLRILSKTSGVPTHLVAIRSDLDPELQAKIKEALLKISSEQKELITDVYGAAKLVEVDEEKHLAGAVAALKNTGLEKKKLVK